MKNNSNISNTDEIQIGDFVKHSKEYWGSLISIKDEVSSRRMIVLDILYDIEREKKYVRVYNICGYRMKHGPDKYYEWTVEQLEKIC